MNNPDYERIMGWAVEATVEEPCCPAPRERCPEREELIAVATERAGMHQRTASDYAMKAVDALLAGDPCSLSEALRIAARERAMAVQILEATKDQFAYTEQFQEHLVERMAFNDRAEYLRSTMNETWRYLVKPERPKMFGNQKSGLLDRMFSDGKVALDPEWKRGWANAQGFVDRVYQSDLPPERRIQSQVEHEDFAKMYSGHADPFGWGRR